MGEHGRPIFGNVLVEQDASLSILADAPPRLALKKRVIAQILAIMLDQIECIEDCGSSGLTTG
jgi:hypothetical protein